MRFFVETLEGSRFVLQGLTFLARQRLLWKWAILPTLVNCLVFTAAFAIFVLYAYSPLYQWITRFITPDAPEAWYAWLWVAPLQILAWLLGGLLFLSVLVLLSVIFLLVGTAIAGPFLAILAQRVEVLVTGHVAPESTTFWGVLKGIGGSLWDEGLKLGFFIGLQLLFFCIGLFPPLSPVMACVSTLFTMLFLPLEYAGFAMDNRQLRFVERRALIWRHRWLMLGFGMASFVILLVPLLNFFCLPILVTGGTLLFLHIETFPRPA